MSNRDPGTYLYGEIFSTAVLSEGEGPPTPADVWAAFGITDPNSKPPTDPPRGSGDKDPPKDPPQDPPKDPQDPPQDPPKDTPEDSDKDPNKDPNKDPKDPPKDPPKNPPPENKAAAEFARMRIENKRLATLLGDVAKILGIQDISDPEKMLQAVQEKVLQAQAKAAGIPEDVLKRQKDIEEKLTQYEQNQLRTQAYLGFQKVMDTYNLTQAQLNAFADELLEQGRNPFTTPMDLVKEYRDLHWEDILKAEREKALQEEADRAAKAASHSTQPLTKDGKPGGDPAKITTVRDLDIWMNSK